MQGEECLLEGSRTGRRVLSEEEMRGRCACIHALLLAAGADPQVCNNVGLRAEELLDGVAGCLGGEAVQPTAACRSEAWLSAVPTPLDIDVQYAQARTHAEACMDDLHRALGVSGTSCFEDAEFPADGTSLWSSIDNIPDDALIRHPAAWSRAQQIYPDNELVKECADHPSINVVQGDLGKLACPIHAHLTATLRRRLLGGGHSHRTAAKAEAPRGPHRAL